MTQEELSMMKRIHLLGMMLSLNDEKKDLLYEMMKAEVKDRENQA